MTSPKLTAVNANLSIVKPTIVGALLLAGWPATAQDGDSRRISVGATITPNTQDHVEWLRREGVLIEYIATEKARGTTDKKTEASGTTRAITPATRENKITKPPAP